MKKFNLLLVFIFSIVLLSGCTHKKEAPKDLLGAIKFKNKILIGIKNDSKPFGYMYNGEPVGFDIDIAKEITKTLLGNEENVDFLIVTPESRISDLNSKKVDIIIATMSINPKRATIVDFTNPYFVAGQALMVKKDSKIFTIENLNDKKVVIILGTTGERTVRQLAPNATVIGKENYTSAFELLKSGEVDAMLADDSILYGFVMDDSNYKILPARYTKEYYAIALRQGEENIALKKELDKIIENMQYSGQLNRIKYKWIPNIHSMK